VPDEYVIGVDWATSSPTAYVLVGVKHRPDGRPRVWVESELYYDPERSQRQRSCDELANDMLGFMAGRAHPSVPISAVYVDPSASALELDFERAGISVTHADNDVAGGIQTVAKLLRTGLFTVDPQRCPNLVREFPGYVWDPKASARGKDEPVKADDHALDATRYALHSRGLGGGSLLDLLPAA
jgi:hypothetical protein